MTVTLSKCLQTHLFRSDYIAMFAVLL